MQSDVSPRIIVPGVSVTQTSVEENNQDNFYRADFQ